MDRDGGVGLAEPWARPAPVGRQARAVFDRAAKLVAMAEAVTADHARARAEVRTALAPLRQARVRRELETIPVTRLKDVTEGRLRLGAMELAGYDSVAKVLAARSYDLRQVPGIGAQSADQAIAAARQIAAAVEEHVAVRIGAEDRADPAATALVVALNRLVNAGPEVPRAADTAARVAAELTPLLAEAHPAGARLRLLVAGRRGRQRAQDAVRRIEDLLAEHTADGTPLLLTQASTDLLRPAARADEAWLDFEVRAAEYGVLLAEIAELAPDIDASEGFLPTSVSERVRAQQLDDTHRRVSLRGYQAFGARFALAQKRVVIGDEMGLGKTIQAIAALAHLRAEGSSHFLVVCPASVLVNWSREIESRSALDAYRLHGNHRGAALREWTRDGGVGVTTFDALVSLDVPDDVPLGMLVVDEAHYVKNPDTRRSQAVARWTARTDRVLFLTGTPMENHVEEFRNLVQHLQPGLVPHIRQSDAVAGSQAFRRAVAPAYLRRNQQDVLTELPELAQSDEWEEFSRADLAAYRSAVAAGNFMAMRRAAYAVPARSAKLQRLRELVAEAAENDLKVVVFSFFRDVLSSVRLVLGPSVHGPLTGAVPATERQRIVDAFAAAPGHAVLLSQIQAGGTGLNMQAASVVILCEPQVKPTLEAQAIGRAHRMGQIRHVRVHRLLIADSVDQRMLDILGTKQVLFDAYARRSDLAESTPDAVDISEQSLARQIVAEEQTRLSLTKGEG
ncbi:Helicase conserved C-terminal domain-containing protein [Actinacidiphila alni]|uniref:Helicase conserved C-terminal domain-containing protein n=1 Tax=Actinacidiphila alni TaxID=380248 RepID=A0A1I1XCL4_9ACTN|nr:DEAD/DEAH box helicase [Actinacidiphila alni]SFE03473.1 Helicase conserved C-terminal domain-containing protein [Actinacidiphila alni]